jgi:hypothetical protein
MLLCIAFSMPAADEIEWTESSAKLPINYNEKRKGEIRQLELLVSSDRGATWARYAVAQPGQQHFEFKATKDGPYWFIMAIEYHTGKREPADVSKEEPGVKMHVRVAK